MIMWIFRMFLSMLWSMAGSIVSGLGVGGCLVLIAGLVLAFSMWGAAKRYFATPKGMLVLVGLLVAGLAVSAFTARAGWASLSPAMRAKLLAAKQKAVEAAGWRKSNAQADADSLRLGARILAANSGGGGMPLPGVGPSGPATPHVAVENNRPAAFHGGGGSATQEAIGVSSPVAGTVHPAVAFAPPAASRPAPVANSPANAVGTPVQAGGPAATTAAATPLTTSSVAALVAAIPPAPGTATHSLAAVKAVAAPITPPAPATPPAAANPSSPTNMGGSAAAANTPPAKAAASPSGQSAGGIQPAMGGPAKAKPAPAAVPSGRSPAKAPRTLGPRANLTGSPNPAGASPPQRYGRSPAQKAKREEVRKDQYTAEEHINAEIRRGVDTVIQGGGHPGTAHRPGRAAPHQQHKPTHPGHAAGMQR